MKRFLFLLSTTIISAFFSTAFSQELPSKSEILSKMKLANEFWISQNTNPGNNQWARAVYFAGNTEFYKTYPKDQYLQYSNLWATNSNWGLNGGTSTRNADNQTCGQAYIDLYNLDLVKQDNKITAIKTSIDNMVNSSAYNDWWWIDAIFMSMPVFTRFGVMNNDTAYFEKMHSLYKYTKDTLGLYNYSKGLWYRDSNYKPPYTTKNGLDCFWARGNGWVIGAHARVLQLLPKNNSHRAEYVQTFQQMAAALKDRQRSDGFWNSSLEDPDEYNGPETSGTAFFTYGIAWGINNHLLDSVTYYPIVVKAWNGLITTALQTNGFLGYVQGVGAQPGLASVGTTQDFGVGAFLLAGTELLKLASGDLAMPSNFYPKSVKVVDNTHLNMAFSKKIDSTSGLKTENYVINNGISVVSVAKGDNDSTAVLTISELTPGNYQIQMSNILSTDGSAIENGQTLSFVYSNVVSVTASGYEAGTSNTPDKTLDYDFSTRWSSLGIGQWILYDLGEVKQVNSVDMAFYSGNTRKAFFSINLSSNLTDSVQVFNGSSSGKKTTLENFDFLDQKARYVKIIGNGNSQSLWNSITETRINWTAIGTGVNEIAQDNLKIYPNPVKGTNFCVFSDDFSTSKINITDLSGKVLYKDDLKGNKSNIDISKLKLSKGTYVISVSNERYSKSTLLMIE